MDSSGAVAVFVHHTWDTPALLARGQALRMGRWQVLQHLLLKRQGSQAQVCCCSWAELSLAGLQDSSDSALYQTFRLCLPYNKLNDNRSYAWPV